MKLNPKFPELEGQMKRIGAQKPTWRLPSLTIDERQKFIEALEEGIEFPHLEDVTSFGGLLTHKGEQIVLYIKDTGQDEYTLLNDTVNAVRFHVFDCQTLDDMRRRGRSRRYVSTRETSGKFWVEARDKTGSVKEIKAPLRVCKNCLYGLEWQGCARPQPIPEDVWENFSLQDFFAEYATFFSFKPQYSDETAPRGGYARDWHRIATRYKRQRNWCCDQCGVNLLDHRSLLHAHHKNGVLYENHSSNIAVLCVLCHAEQPLHQRIRPSPEDRSRIEELRRRQRRKGSQNQTGSKTSQTIAANREGQTVMMPTNIAIGRP